MNLTELARLCGCTPSTVSKAFRNSPNLHPDTKNRILDAARANGITVSTEQILRGRTVLVLVPTFNNEANSRRLSIMQKKLHTHGISMLAASWEYDPAGIMQLPAFARTVRGLCGIVCYDSITPDCAASMKRLHVPIVTSVLSSGFDCTYLPMLDGYRQAVRHLAEHGRQRIAFIGETYTASKEFSFRQAMAELGLPIDNRQIYRSKLYSSAAGAEGFDALFSGDTPPDAVLCAYDYIALGVLNCAQAAGMDVPGELAVIGADNIKAAYAYRLGLTTLAADREQMADTLIELLIRRIREPDAPLQQIAIPWNLIIRETG